MDLLIAAIAIAHGQELLTRNPNHFAGIRGLVVEAY
jgi:predicted nucleic acid-binding protein